jgi:hypothetical protein
MSRGYFEDAPYADTSIANQTQITATVETGLWNVQQYTPIPANDIRAGKIYRLTASGLYSTGASGTLTITPRWGTTTGGTTLGASVAQTVPINLTNEAWFMQAILVVRAVGAPGGANSTVMLGGMFQGSGAAGTAGSSCDVCFGGTAGSIDSGSAAGLFIGWTLSVAGAVTPMNIVWQSIN